MVVAEEMWGDRVEVNKERNYGCSAWTTEGQGLGIHDFSYMKDWNGCYKKEGLDIFVMASRGRNRVNEVSPVQGRTRAFRRWNILLQEVVFKQRQNDAC